MSEQIREQVSAFLDGELPNAETELLLKRLARDAELRESFGRYALIGEACRGAPHEHLTRGLTARINRAIDGEPKPAYGSGYPARSRRWWHPVAGAAVAAGVAAVAVVALQQRAVSPTLRPGAAVVAQNLAAGRSKELPIYTTPAPAPLGEAPAALPAARLTNYVFAHSKYSSMLGQSNVLSGLLTAADEEPTPTPAPPETRSAP
jgi:sigma-E factor negative regulatory protein RseA